MIPPGEAISYYDTSMRPGWRQALVFVAVVWSIAAAYLAFEAGMMALTSQGGSNWLPAGFVLPRQSPEGLRHCQEVLKTIPPAARDVVVDARDWYASWKLGLALGKADGLLTARKPGAEAKPFVEQSRVLALQLAVPPPGLPKHGRNLYEIRDFALFLAQDPPCVAAALEFRYSTRYAALYRFGGVVGFNSIMGQVAPGMEDVLAPDIRGYGTQAKIPEQLWRPLMGSGDGLARQAAVERLDAYVRTSSGK